MNTKARAGKILCRLLLGLLALLLCALLLLAAVPLLERVDRTPVEGSGDWMAALEDHRLLSAIALPGTHDSATEHVQLAFFSRCQDLSVLEQLEAGYRYLDIRLGPEGDGLKLMHGFTSCRTGAAPWSKALLLEDLLRQCYDFLDRHPTEAVVFMVKEEYGGLSAADFQARLHAYIQADPAYWHLSDRVPTLGEARGKLVLMRRYEDALALGADAGLPMAWGAPSGGDSQWAQTVSEAEFEHHALQVQDLYELDSGEKWMVFSSFLEALGERDDDAVRINFLSTKGPLTYGHPYRFARELNRKLLDQPLTPGEPCGWVLVDFGTPALARHIYGAN